MTRAEFEELDSWGDLWSFAEEIGCEDIFEDVVWGDELDDWIWEDIRNYDGTWEGLADLLNNIPQGYNMYRKEYSLEYYSIDNDFDCYKDDIRDYAERNEYFDEEEEEEELEEEEEANFVVNAYCETSPDNAGVFMPELDIDEVFRDAQSSYVVMVDERLRAKREIDEAIRSLSADAAS